jgi:ABC-type multidrug transport system fused ATPase/permease subunit
MGSQAGHLLAYQVRFGAAAQQLQSSGAHAYFPSAVRGALGLAAALALAAVFVIGLARSLGGRPVQRGSAPAYLRLVAMLFTIQLATFAAQEVGEGMVAGAGAASAAHLLLWGTLGQLPVALVAAAGLRWLLARFESAVEQIRIALASKAHQIAPAAILIGVWGDLTPVLKPAAHSSPAKRGPPSLRFSSN